MKQVITISDHAVREDMSFCELEELRTAFDIPQRDVCRRMGAIDATYSRWKSWAKDNRQGCKPRASSLVSLRSALKGIIREKIQAMKKVLAPAE